MYYSGLGIVQNDMTAYMWLEIATSSGTETVNDSLVTMAERAEETLAVLRERMTPDQLAKAQRRATDRMTEHQQ